MKAKSKRMRKGGLGSQASRGQGELPDTRIGRVKHGRMAKLSVDRNFERIASQSMRK
jgi:hypothetical protein